MYEQRNSDDVEYEQIEYVLSILFQVRDNAVYATFDLSFVVVKWRINVETGHSVTNYTLLITFVTYFINHNNYKYT